LLRNIFFVLFVAFVSFQGEKIMSDHIQRQVNKAWIADQLNVLRISQRALANRLEVDPASFSKTLNGQRRLQIDEATKLAGIFSCKLGEVLENFGLTKKDGIATVELLGCFDGSGIVTPHDWNARVHDIFDPEIPKICLQSHVGGVMDGWMYFFKVEKSPIQLDQAAMFSLDDGTQVFGYAKRGYLPGEYRIMSYSGDQLKGQHKLEVMQELVGVVPPR
jgi:transcriptional regulator with XRE-family HTH domain